jgi:hypothetical protein
MIFVVFRPNPKVEIEKAPGEVSSPGAREERKGILWRQLFDSKMQINPWSCRSTFCRSHLPGFLPYHPRTMVIAGETWQQGFRFCLCTVAKGAKCFRSVQGDIFS